MDKHLRKLIIDSEKVSLTVTEREELRKAIISFVRLHPPAEKLSFLRSFQIFPRSILNLKPAPVLIIFFLLATGSSVAVASERALPGDFLYPVKVKVSEELRSAFSFSGEARADWELERLERRLGEAEFLAQRGELSEEYRMRIEENFERHSERIRERIEELEEANVNAAANLSSNLETSLNAHEKILLNLAGQAAWATASVASDTPSQISATGPEKELSELIYKVKAKKKTSVNLRASAETKVSQSPKPQLKKAAEGRLKAAENKITEVKNFLEKKRIRLGEKAIAEVEVRIKLAEKMISDSKIRFETEAYEEAFRTLQRAHRALQEAKLLIEVKENLDIELKLNGGESGNEDDVEKPEDNARKNENEIEEEKNTSTNIQIDTKGHSEFQGRLNEIRERLRLDINLNRR
jgi:hypothetical protein